MMFKFSFKKIYVADNKLYTSTESKKLVSPTIINFLDEYEKLVYNSLLKKQSFKYVQSSISAFSIFESLKKSLPKNVKIEMMTRHPNMTAGILLEKLIPSQISGNETYALYFKGDFGRCWLNSQAKSQNIVNEMSKLLNISFVKKNIQLNLIEVFGSSLLQFRETQLGAKTKRWTINKL